MKRPRKKQVWVRQTEHTPMSFDEIAKSDPVGAYGYECMIDHNGANCIDRNEACPDGICPAATAAFIRLRLTR